MLWLAATTRRAILTGWCVVASLAVLLALPRLAWAQTTFTTPTFISDSDFTYDGQSIVVDGTTVTMDGAHNFAALTLTNGAILTHTQGHPGGIDLTVTGAVVIEAGTTIDLNLRGNHNTAASGRSGASYGGRGHDVLGVSGGSYGSITGPRDLGQGGAGGTSFGGGAIRITAASIQLDGVIQTTGTGPAAFTGGGSGGSIWLDVGTLSGSGSLQANGGGGSSSGAGGGGRIAISYDSLQGFPLDTNVSCTGGISGSSGSGGGSIYMVDRTTSTSTLRVDNGAISPTLPGTEITWPGTVTHFDIHAALVQIATPGLVQLSGQLTLTSNATLRHFQGDITGLHINNGSGGSIAIDATSRIDASLMGNLSTAATGRSGGSHGGHGQAVLGAHGSTYGDYQQPNTLGEGGAPPNNATRGGGAIRITTGSLNLDGTILANGGGPSAFTGGGAGGSVWIHTTTLSGSGSIHAEGASGNNSGGGGGGRIAVTYQQAPGFDFTSGVLAAGGIAGGAGTIYLHDLTTGTTTLRFDNANRQQSGTPSDVSVVPGSVTNLQVRHDGYAVLNGAPPISYLQMTDGRLTVAVSSWDVLVDATLLGDSVLDHTLGQVGGVELVVGGTMTVGEDARVDVSRLGLGPSAGTTGRSGGSYGGRGIAWSGVSNPSFGNWRSPTDLGTGGTGGNDSFGGGAIRIEAGSLSLDGQILSNGSGPLAFVGGGSGGSIWLDVGSLSGTGSVQAHGGFGNNSGSGGGGRIAIEYDGPSSFDLDAGVSSTGGNGGGAGTIYLRDGSTNTSTLRIDNLAVSTGAPGTELSWSGTTTHLDLRSAFVEVTVPGQISVTGDVSLSSSATLQHFGEESTGLGVFSTSGTIEIDATSSLNLSGRGAGILAGTTGRSGGSHGGFGQSSNGGVAGPPFGNYLQPTDLGGGGTGGAGSRGGGRLHLTAPNLVVNGSIQANGTGPQAFVGGGAGGSLLLQVGSLSGTGVISANGGNGSSSGSGGGGRIALYYDDASGFDVDGKVQAFGGFNGAGGAGTIYLFDQTQQQSVLRFDNNGTVPFNPLATPLAMQSGTVDAVVATGTANVLLTETPDVSTVLIEDGSRLSLDTPLWNIQTSLVLQTGGVLAHEAAACSGARLRVLGTMSVDASSAVDVTAAGDSVHPQTTGRSGGSYGGLGGASSGASNPVFGSATFPADLGTGGAAGSQRGGGRIRLAVDSLVLDGALRSNGGGPAAFQGGGSGGSIWLDVGTLSGAGTIQAAGGSGNNSGGGGGGRIAVYYNDASGFSLAGVTTPGGPGGGQAGTVHLEQTGVPVFDRPFEQAQSPTCADLCSGDDAVGDPDGDGLCSDLDNCPNDANPGQEDDDGDTTGNACDVCPNDPLNDADGDGVCGDIDNCPDVHNPSQADSNQNGVGDACEPIDCSLFACLDSVSSQFETTGSGGSTRALFHGSGQFIHNGCAPLDLLASGAVVQVGDLQLLVPPGGFSQEAGTFVYDVTAAGNRWRLTLQTSTGRWQLRTNTLLDGLGDLTGGLTVQLQLGTLSGSVILPVPGFDGSPAATCEGVPP